MIRNFVCFPKTPIIHCWISAAIHGVTGTFKSAVYTRGCRRERGTRAHTHHAPARANSVSRPTTGEVMRSTVLCIALGLSIASAKRDPSFIPADDEILDPSLRYTPVNSVNYHGVLETAGRQPVVMAYLDDSLPNYEELRETYNRAVATFGCLAPDRNYMMPSGINVRARFIVGEDDVTMPSLSIFRRKRRATFAGNWTEAELRDWVYKELAGLEFVEEDAEYDAFVKSTDKTAVRAARGGLAIVACACERRERAICRRIDESAQRKCVRAAVGRSRSSSSFATPSRPSTPRCS